MFYFPYATVIPWLVTLQDIRPYINIKTFAVTFPPNKFMINLYTMIQKNRMIPQGVLYPAMIKEREEY